MQYKWRNSKKTVQDKRFRHCGRGIPMARKRKSHKKIVGVDVTIASYAMDCTTKNDRRGRWTIAPCTMGCTTTKIVGVDALIAPYAY